MTIEEREALTKEAWQAWEEYQKTNPNAVNPAAFVYGYLVAAQKTKPQSIEFFKWNALKIDGYIKYVEQIKPLVTSHEIEEALNIFEGSTIEERYDLFIQSQSK